MKLVEKTNSSKTIALEKYNKENNLYYEGRTMMLLTKT